MKQTLKKSLLFLLSFVMVFLSFGSSIYAGIAEDFDKQPNAVVSVYLSNPDCEKIKEAEMLNRLYVQIFSEQDNFSVTVPVEKVVEDGEFFGIWMNLPEMRLDKELMRQMSEIQDRIELGNYTENPEDFFTDMMEILSCFKVRVTGLPEGHFTEEGACFIMTSKLFRTIMEMVKDIFAEMIADVDSYAEMLDLILEDMGTDLEEVLNELDSLSDEDLQDMEMTREDIEMIKSWLLNIDEVIAYLSGDEFTGLLSADIMLDCDCPYIESYQISHRYYEKRGGKLKLVGIVHEGEYNEDYEGYYLTGKSGDIIKASDFINTSYKGKDYRFIGSYDDMALYDDFKWSEYETDSFVLGGDDENYVSSMVLRYVIDTDKPASGNTAAPGSDKPGSGSAHFSPAENAESAPATGDDTPLALYLLLAAGAGCVLSVLLLYQKNLNKNR